MTKTLDTLVDDIYSLFTEGADVQPDDAEKLGHAIAKVITSRISSAKEERKEHLRLSNIGKMPVHLWYKLRGYKPEPMEPHTYLKFLIGDIQEEVLLFLAKVAGHTVEGEQDAIEIGGVLGHRDAIIDGVTVDVKTASNWSFDNKFRGLGLFEPNGDGFGYIPQLAAYCQGDVKEQAAPMAKHMDGAWLVSNKETGKLHLTWLHSMQQPNMFDYVENVKAMVEADEPPPPPEGVVIPDGKSGNMKLAPIASYDSMKKYIWPNIRMFLYSNGPRYLTEVVVEPKVAEKDMETGEIIVKEQT